MPEEDASKHEQLQELEELVHDNEVALGRIRRMVDELKGELRKERGGTSKAGVKSGSDPQSPQGNSRLQGGGKNS